MRTSLPSAPIPPSPEDGIRDSESALSAVLKALLPLDNDSRKRVLYAATAFYRVER